MNRDIRFLVTQSCNFDCFFCHHEGYEKRSSSKYNLDSLEKIYHYAKRNNIKDISITGGEPFMYWDKLKYLLNYFGTDDFKITLNTNLIYADKYINFLKNLKNVEYHVNFSSTKKDVHESIINANYLQKLLDNLQLFKNLNLNICLNIPVLNTINSDELIEIFDYSKKMGFLPRFLVLLPVKKEHKKYYMDVEDIMSKIPESVLKRKYSYGRHDISSKLGNYEIVKCLCVNHECDICRQTTYIHLTPELNARLCMESKEEYEINFFNELTVDESFKALSRRLVR